MKERASTHEVTCFDHATGIYVVVLQDFSCTCGKPRQYHFVCSHLVGAARHRNYDIEARIPHEFGVDMLVQTWRPRFMPFRDPRECLHMTVQSTLWIQLTVGTSGALERGRGTGWL
jgi:hypothetical protein